MNYFQSNRINLIDKQAIQIQVKGTSICSIILKTLIQYLKSMPNSTRISLEKRQKLVSLVMDSHLSISKAGKRLFIKPSTAKLIIKKYRETGTFFSSRYRTKEAQPIEQPHRSETPVFQPSRIDLAQIENEPTQIHQENDFQGWNLVIIYQQAPFYPACPLYYAFLSHHFVGC